MPRGRRRRQRFRTPATLLRSRQDWRALGSFGLGRSGKTPPPDRGADLGRGEADPQYNGERSFGCREESWDRRTGDQTRAFRALIVASSARDFTPSLL